MNLGAEFKMEKKLFLDRFAVWERLFPLHDVNKSESEINSDFSDMEVTVYSQVIWVLPNRDNRFK